MDTSKLLPHGGKAEIVDKAAGQTIDLVGTDDLFLPTAKEEAQSSCAAHST